MGEIIQVRTNFGTYKVQLGYTPLGEAAFEASAQEAGVLLFKLEREEALIPAKDGVVDLEGLRKAADAARQNVLLSNQIHLEHALSSLQKPAESRRYDIDYV